MFSRIIDYPVQEQAVGRRLADAKAKQIRMKTEQAEQRKEIRKMEQQKRRQLKCARMCSNDELIEILKGKQIAEVLAAAGVPVPEGNHAVGEPVLGGGDHADGEPVLGGEDHADGVPVPDRDHADGAPALGGDRADGVLVLKGNHADGVPVPVGDHADGVPLHDGDHADCVPVQGGDHADGVFFF
jgi:hypothetical protein